MSEFRFNCPVCGQHIATDSGSSGAQIECPTCFQSIIVPQAPQAHTKYILSATQYIKPQPTTRLASASFPAAARRRTFVPEFFVALFFVCVLGVVLYVAHSRHSRSDSASSPAESTDALASSSLGTNWRLSLAGVSFPDVVAAGRVRNENLTFDRTYLQNGALVLRQGAVHQPELAVNVYFPVRESQALAGRQFNIETNDAGMVPRIVLRWKEGDLQVAQSFTNGYAMKLDFGSIAADKMPGRIYLCLPDVSKSFVVGSFNAEIRKLAFPKQ
jgi:hypothetical protein